jgi:hypothetical protein
MLLSCNSGLSTGALPPRAGRLIGKNEKGIFPMSIFVRTKTDCTADVARKNIGLAFDRYGVGKAAKLSGYALSVKATGVQKGSRRGELLYCLSSGVGSYDLSELAALIADALREDVTVAQLRTDIRAFISPRMFECAPYCAHSVTLEAGRKPTLVYLASVPGAAEAARLAYAAESAADRRAIERGGAIAPKAASAPSKARKARVAASVEALPQGDDTEAA